MTTVSKAKTTAKTKALVPEVPAEETLVPEVPAEEILVPEATAEETLVSQAVQDDYSFTVMNHGNKTFEMITRTALNAGEATTIYCNSYMQKSCVLNKLAKLNKFAGFNRYEVVGGE